MDYSQLITIEPGKRSGQPCIRGMRITVQDVLEYLAGGMTPDEVLADFPDLTAEDIRACLAFAGFLRRKYYHDGMVTLTIKLPEAVKQLLEREARQSGKSVSALIREAVAGRLRKSTAGGSLYGRTRDLCGAGASGRPDLATNREVFREFGE